MRSTSAPLLRTCARLRPRTLAGVLVVATLAASLLGACGGRQVPTPVARFADAPPAPESPALEAGAWAMVDEVSRPVLSAPRVVDVAHACAPGVGLAPGACSVAVPPEAAAAPLLLLEITRVPERGETEGRVQRTLVPTPPDGVLPLPHGLRPRKIRRVELRAVPPLATADRTTAPLAIPAGAVLRFSVALDEAMREVAATPVQLSVSAVDVEGERPLFERVLDPAARDLRGWHDVEVPLEALRGRTMSLRFRARPVGDASAAAAFPLWGDPTVWAPERAPERPTIVLVSLDTLRARSMSAYGSVRETTPYFERLARDGVLFERAYTTFSNTLGSHMSMMTGLYPAAHGLIGLDRRLGSEHRTLAGTLRAAGYDTAAFTEDALLEGALGFERGFSCYAANRGVFPAAGDAQGTFARALDWARTRGERPFFLFVHTYAVHLPYEPAPAYAKLFTDDGPPAEQGVEHHRLRYEQEVRALDDDLAKLVAGLLEIVPRERLVLVVTADHGEEFGEHGQMTHLQLHDEVMHVPLLVVAPGARGGARVAEPVSLVDLMPTLLALAGVEAPPSEGVPLDGVLRGADAPSAQRTLFGQSLPYDLTGGQWRFVARDARAKCLLDEQGDGRCFDLASDPGEHVPLPPGTSPVFATVHAAAAAYRERARPGIAAGKAEPFSSSAADALDEATRRKLHALGYLD